MNACLEFRSVSLSPDAAGEAGMTALSFALAPGALALLETMPDQLAGTMVDLAAGLLIPEDGQVAFEDQLWTARIPDEAAAARGRIGRVFGGPGWVSNLDVDENITLSTRYHGHAEVSEAQQQAEALAQRLGLTGLPVGRPAHVARSELRRAQWVRALLGPRTLVILEYPLREVSPEWGDALLAEVERRRAEGVAFLWIQSHRGEIAAERLKPTLQFKVERGNIIAV